MKKVSEKQKQARKRNWAFAQAASIRAQAAQILWTFPECGPEITDLAEKIFKRVKKAHEDSYKEETQ